MWLGRELSLLVPNLVFTLAAAWVVALGGPAGTPRLRVQ